jgi:hypothetical protein
MILRRATLHAEGKRLVLKNPINTARVSLLLELFPHAKFIHIHRDPYEVFLSTRHLHQEVLRFTRLQDFSRDDLVGNVIGLYRTVLERFLADKERIPPENFVEIGFADLERDPVGVLRRIYDRLAIPGFAAAAPAFQRYVSAQAYYRRNSFTIGDDDIALVNRHWRFAFETWGYTMRHPGRTAGAPAAAVAAARATTADHVERVAS